MLPVWFVHVAYLDWVVKSWKVGTVEITIGMYTINTQLFSIQFTIKSIAGLLRWLMLMRADTLHMSALSEIGVSGIFLVPNLLVLGFITPSVT